MLVTISKNQTAFCVFQPTNIVVYGRCVEAYIVIQRLLAANVPGERLILVKPPSHISSLSICDDGCEGDPFNEPVVSDAIVSCLKKAGVQIFNDHVLAKWTLAHTETGRPGLVNLTLASLL